MEKILVPTDFTPIAELGLKLAVEIAARSGATVSLVNFMKHPFGRTFTATGDVTMKTDPEEEHFMLELLRTNKAKLQDLAAEYSREGVEIEYAIIDDELKDGIDEYLEREYIDLVVMGTSGEENAKEVFTGNRTEQVIQVSSCPVLSVRDGFKIEDFSDIVLAVNIIKDEEVLPALNTLRQFAECFNSQIHLVHARDKASDISGDLNDYVNQMAVSAGLQNYDVTILEVDDQAEGVIQFARKVHAGIIAVIKNSKEGIFRVFSNHFSDRLVKEV